MALQNCLICNHGHRRRRRLRDRHDHDYGSETGIDGYRSYRSCLDSGSFFGGCDRYRGNLLHVSGVVMETGSMILNGFGICFHPRLWTEEQRREIGLGNAKAIEAGRCLIWGRNDPEVVMHPVGERSGRKDRVRLLHRRGIRPELFPLGRLWHRSLRHVERQEVLGTSCAGEAQSKR